MTRCSCQLLVTVLLSAQLTLLYAYKEDFHIYSCLGRATLNTQLVRVREHSFAHNNACCRDLLQAMASQAMQRLQQFNSQNISNTLWAFASLNHHPGPMLLKVLQRELVHKLRQFTPQGIENVLWAFATLGHHPG